MRKCGWGRKNSGKTAALAALITAVSLAAPLTAWADGPGGPGISTMPMFSGPVAFVDGSGNVVEGAVAKGISVSKYQNRASESQGGIDWQQVRNSGVSFAMVRLGYLNDLDPYFQQNMTGASAAGIKTGVFFYTQALTDEAVAEEANFVLSQIKDYPISYPVAYDVESQYLLDNGLTREQITSHAKIFCDIIRQAGYRPMVYTNKNWLDSYLDVSKLVSDSGEPYDIWFARYGSDSTCPNRTIWQCTDSGTVNGIAGNVAIEYAFVDYGALIPAEGWKLADNTWYYVKDYRIKTGWLTLGDKTYYLEPDGKMACGVTKNIDGADYTFDGSGALITG